MTHSLDAGSLGHGLTPALRVPPGGGASADDLRALRATIDLAPVGIAHFDADGRFRLVNDRLCAILGYTREELLARTFQDVTFPDEVAHSAALTAQLAADVVPSPSHEKRFVRRDGSIVWARVTASAVRRPGGDIDFLLGIVEDISDERAAESARRHAEERLHLALDASLTGTFRWDPRTNALECDENLGRLFGLSSGTVSSANDLMARVHPEDRQRLLEAWWLCAAEGAELDEEFRVVWPDGSTHWLSDRGRMFVDADGAPVYLAGACTDVTEHRRVQEKLRAQEEIFRTLANTIPQLAWMADASGWIYWYNQRWYDYTGTTLEDVQGWGWQKVHHPDHVQRVVARIQSCFATGEPWEDTFPLRDRDGQYRWFLSRALPIRNRDGNIVGWFGTNTDITERLAAEHALREREAEFRTLANAIPQMAWIADGQCRRSWFNDRWYEFSGLSFEESCDVGWHRLLHPDHSARMIDGQRAAFARGEVWEDTYPLRRKDGVYRWFLTRAVPIRGVDGDTVRWLGTNTDITDRLDAEQAVRASEAKLRRIAESGLIGIFYWTNDGEITEANDQFCRMLGFTSEDVRAGALNWRSLTPPEWQTAGLAKEAELAARGVVTPWEKEFHAKDGRRVPVLVGSALLEGRSDRGVAVCLDISLQKEAEAERERLLALERAARTEAERAIKLRDEVLGIVAHDLRNPVHTITMSASTVLDIPLPEDERIRQLEIIQRSAKGMHHLISDLLDVTRIESGTFAIQPVPLQVAVLIDELVERFASRAQGRAITLDRHVSPDVPFVRGDHERLLQVLSNLLDNALKFTQPGGHVGLRAGVRNEQVRISIEDTGCGIPVESLPHIFDRFWQADRVSRAGAGLGLAIARGIVTAHGGELSVESTVGRGTTFHVMLPVAGR